MPVIQLCDVCLYLLSPWCAPGRAGLCSCTCLRGSTPASWPRSRWGRPRPSNCCCRRQPRWWWGLNTHGWGESLHSAGQGPWWSRRSVLICTCIRWPHSAVRHNNTLFLLGRQRKGRVKETFAKIRCIYSLKAILHHHFGWHFKYHMANLAAWHFL